MEHRTFKYEIREMDNATGRFRGYASIFGERIPDFNEIVHPGAFTKTIAERKGKVPILYMHDPSAWIGMTTDMVEDKRGLQIDAELAINDVQRAREVWALMSMAHAANTPAGISVGFRAIKHDQKGGVRNLYEMGLHENSITPPSFQAAPNAKTSEIRSALDDLVTRRIITAEQREMALAEQAAAVTEPDELHSIAQALDRALTNLRAA